MRVVGCTPALCRNCLPSALHHDSFVSALYDSTLPSALYGSILILVPYISIHAAVWYRPALLSALCFYIRISALCCTVPSPVRHSIVSAHVPDAFIRRPCLSCLSFICNMGNTLFQLYLPVRFRTLCCHGLDSLWSMPDSKDIPALDLCFRRSLYLELWFFLCVDHHRLVIHFFNFQPASPPVLIHFPISFFVRSQNIPCQSLRQDTSCLPVSPQLPYCLCLKSRQIPAPHPCLKAVSAMTDIPCS